MNDETQKLSLAELGYDDFFETVRIELGLGGFKMARVVAEHKESYRVEGENGEYLAKVTGKRMFTAHTREDYPVVGDWVAVLESGKGTAAIHEILPRKTMIKRKAGGKSGAQIVAANVDMAFIVQAIGGDYSLNRFERYLTITAAGGAAAVIVLNKIDLASEGELAQKTGQIKKRFDDTRVIACSAATGAGLDEFKLLIARGKTCCFLGSSGVGKSTLINKLAGKDIAETKRIDARTERGRHATVGRQMYFLENGGILIDNPGMREVGMADSESGIGDLFEHISALAGNCKYADCTHRREPGCAVRAAAEAGDLDKEQYANYLELKKEAEFFEMSEIEKREKDRRFGKFIKSVKKQVKKYKY